jgi:NitT/TauT family transport system permease protein
MPAGERSMLGADVAALSPARTSVARARLRSSLRGGAAQVLAVQLLIAAGLIAALEILSRSFPLLPPVARIAAAAWDLLTSAAFYAHSGITLAEALLGFAVGTLLGVLIGILVGVNRFASDVFSPMLLAVYAVPKIVFLPLILMIFGVGFTPKAANAALHAFFPVVLNSLVAMREVNAIHLKTARSMKATHGQMVAKIYLPSMVLPMFTGMRLALGFAFLGALLAELFESKAGLGFLVNHHYNLGEIDRMLTVIVLVLALTIAINSAIKTLEERLTRWRATLRG